MIMIYNDNDLVVFNKISNSINKAYEEIKDENYIWKSVYSNNDVVINKTGFFHNLHEFIFGIDNIISHDENLKKVFELPVDALNEKIIALIESNDYEFFFQDFIYIFNDFFEKYILHQGYEGFSEFIQKLQGRTSFYHYLRDILPVKESSFNTGFFNFNSSNSNSYIINKIKRLEGNYEISESKIKEQILFYLNTNDQYFKEKANEALNSFTLTINDFLKKYENNEKRDIEELSQSVAESRKELENLFGDINQHKSIVSEKTQDEISKFYTKKSIWERNTYFAMTLLSLVIILIAVCLAWSGLSNYYANYVDPTGFIKSSKNLTVDQFKLTQTYAFNYLILRLVISALLFLTIIYTSRIAYRAYIHWRHSENMHLKLSSLRPFINQLQKDERNQIHKDLIPDYFGKDAGMVDGVSEKFKDLPANVSALAIKAIEQIGGSKEKKEEENKNNQNGEPNK